MDGDFRGESREDERRRDENYRHPEDIDTNNYTMDDRGNIRNIGNTAAIRGKNARAYLILGWISAAFTLLISPLFAIAGIIFGILVNQRGGGRGNAVIITNIVLGALNMFFGVLLGLTGLILLY